MAFGETWVVKLIPRPISDTRVSLMSKPVIAKPACTAVNASGSPT